MAQGTIGLRFNIDVGNAASQVDTLTKAMAALNEELAKENEKSEKDWKKISQLNQSLDNATSARGQIMKQANQAQSQQAKENMDGGGIFQGNKAWMVQTALNQLSQSVISTIESGFRSAKQRASGDYAGATVTDTRTKGELIGQGVGVGAGLLLNLIPGVGTALSMILTPMFAQFGKLIGGKDARDMEVALAFAEQYKKVLPEIDTLNQFFGGNINRKLLEANNLHGLEMYGRATEAAEGTGLTTQAFVEAMKAMGGYGIDNETKALNMAQNQALWSRFTGTDLSTIQKYAGQSYRFGSENGAVSTAYGGLMASGMEKGQFSEFLNSMERILEEGISKGFVRSSEEIAGNMVMLYKLSGDSSLWQGEQGAQRLTQMNSAVANSTNLQSVEDIINFSIAQDIFKDMSPSQATELLEGKDRKKNDKGGRYTGTYVDYMQLLERGVDANILQRQFDAVHAISGGDTATMIERFRNMYGLNYTGAAQVWEMSTKIGEKGYSKEEIAKKIENMKTTPGYMSDSALLQDALNKMGNNLANIGKIHFDKTELELIRVQAGDVAAIRASVTGKVDTGIKNLEEFGYSIPEQEIDPYFSESPRTFFELIADEGGKYNVNAVRDHLKALSKGAGEKGDANAQLLGMKWNDMLPSLKSTKANKNVLGLINDVISEFDHANDRGTEAGTKIGSGEYSKINNKLDEVIKALNENTQSTDKNTNADVVVDLPL